MVSFRITRRMLCIVFVAWVGIGSALGLVEDKPTKLRQLDREIVLLNLINGLHLTTEQMGALIDKIDEAERVRNEFSWETERRESSFEDILEDVKEVLSKGEEIPEDLKKRVHRMKEDEHGLEDEMGEKLVRLENEVEALLTKNQLIVVNTYKPCTIPPERGKIGQSVETAAEGMTQLLTRIRRMPGSRYEMMKDMFVDAHLDRIERHLGFENSEEKETWRQKMLETFEKVRRMPDQDFLMQKGELARELMPEEMKTFKPRKNQLSRVGHFLLDPALKPLLERRLKQG